jgi:hypothetical protein
MQLNLCVNLWNSNGTNRRRIADLASLAVCSPQHLGFCGAHRHHFTAHRNAEFDVLRTEINLFCRWRTQVEITRKQERPPKEPLCQSQLSAVS